MFRYALAGVLSLAAMPADAAELRLSFAELAYIAQKVIGDAKVYLNNKPGFLGLASGSSITLTGKQIPLPLPETKFTILDSKYAYYVSDISSTAVAVSPSAGAVRITVTFESDGPELVGGCVEGGCSLVNALPQVEWSAPSLTVEFAPVLAPGGLSLELKSARLGGKLDPVCRNDEGEISAGLCYLSLPFARSTVRKLSGEVEKILKDKVNAPEVQDAIAAAFKPHLNVGSFGTIEIQKVTSDAAGVRVGFRFVGP